MNKKDIIVNLVKKHNLCNFQKSFLNTEYEIIKLRLDYAIYMGNKKNITFYKALDKHFGFKMVVIKGLVNKYKIYLSKFNKKNLIINQNLKFELINKIYLDSKFVKDIITNSSKKDYNKLLGFTCCFGFNIKIYVNSVFIHFNNNTCPKNPFSKNELPKRKKELKAILMIIKKKYPKVKKIRGGSWIYNNPIYRDLLVVKKSELKIRKEDLGNLGSFGQFYRYNGTINQKRVKQFKNNNYKFPLVPLDRCGDINNLYKKYLD